MSRLSPLASARRHALWLFVSTLLGLAASGWSQDVKIQASAPDFASGQFFKLTDTIQWSFTVGRSSDSIPRTQPAKYVIFATGPDIYGNPVFIQVSRGQIPALEGGGTLEFKGEWQIPNDGTLFSQSDKNYQFRLHIFPGDPAAYPATLADLYGAPALLQRVTSFGVNVVPNLAIGVPGVTYRAFSYRGGDIAQFAVNFGNNVTGEVYRGVTLQSRPLRPNRDRYRVGLRLSTNAEYDDVAELPPPGGEEEAEGEEAAPGETPAITTVPDDFSLMRVGLLGDLAGQLPDGASQIRKVEAVGPYAVALPPYGITAGAGPAFIPGSQRNYFPQPNDGFLDLGESVTMYTEQLIPENYAGSYYVLARAFMANDSTQSNNTFVSFAADKITILETASPTIEPASAVVRGTGEFVRGGNGHSDASSVSGDGNFVALSSRASNLRVPAILFEQFQFLYGADADPASIPDPPSEDEGSESASVLAEVKSLLTTNQQIFLRYRQSRETQHVSRTKAGLQASQDCFNPSISADGNYVAYDSTANNLSPDNTGGRSMIYVFNRNTEETVIVSRRADGQIANGSSFNPSLSASGRFVVFESLASNLDSRRTPGGLQKQIYLHDRDVLGTGTFDTPGNIATYLVSVTRTGAVANNLCDQPVVNLNDSASDISSNGGMFVAYASYASNLPQGTGDSMIYRVLVAVDGRLPAASRGPVLSSVEPASVNDLGIEARASGKDLVGAYIVPFSIEPSINGDGSRVAFTSAAVNLVRNDSGTFDPVYPNLSPNDPFALPVAGVQPSGDYNRVPDVFVRDFNAVSTAGRRGTTTRVSISGEERVATGTISFVATAFRPAQPITGVAEAPAGNQPAYQPAPNDQILIQSSSAASVTFRFVAGAPAALNEVSIGATIQATRDNLVDAIRTNAPTLNIWAEPTTPPIAPPGLTYIASLYLRHLTSGEGGNWPIRVTQVLNPAGAIIASGMSGGGRQAQDNALNRGDLEGPPVQGVPLGSGQPSISRDGRYVAFRSVAPNLDVFRSTDPNNVPVLGPLPIGSRNVEPPAYQRPSPATGELIRPLIYPAGNIYLHDVSARSTKRVSVSKFGYPATVDGYTQPLLNGRNLNRTPNSGAPAISADGRFVSFSTDSEGLGGLVFGANNMQPVDYARGAAAPSVFGGVNNRFRDVLVYDRFQTGDAPPQVDTSPVLTIVSPADGTIYMTGTTIVISADAVAARNKRISTVEFRVNDLSIATQTAAPYRTSQVLQNPGNYSITVIATDNFGVQTIKSVRVTARAPLGQPPTVGITHPSDQPAPTAGGIAATPAVVRFSTASTFYVNSLLIPGFGATIDASKVRFLANGEPISGTISKLGDQYGILWRPPANAAYEIVAEGTDSNNNTVVSAPLSIQIAPVARPLPTIAMTKVFAAGIPRVGSTLQVEADFQSNSSTPVTRVDFYANSVFIGSFTPGGGTAGLAGTASVQWLPDAEGTYTLSARAVQIDQTVGGHSIVSANSLTQQVQAAKPLPPGKTAPVVLLTDPISEPRMVLGSEVYININATDPDDARGIATDKVFILVNGEPQSGVRRYGNTWSVRWKPTETGLFTIQATAEDRDGYSSVLPAFSIGVFRGLRPLPQLQMLPLEAAARLNNTTTYSLKARAFFPPQTTDQARVDFYANGVLLGSGFIAQPAGSDGFATYQFDWKPTATTGGDVASLRLSAKATSRNFFTQTQNENVQQQNQIEFYGSTLSNELDPVTVSGVTADTPNQSFVVDLYGKVFYRDPNYGEWKYYVDRLNSGALSQSQVIMEVMGYDPALQKFNYRNLYGQTSGMALSAYYRLKLTPSSDLIQDFINRSLSDTTLLPLTVYPAPGLAAPPYGATVGMGKAFQEIIDSAAFNRSYRLVRGYSNQGFVAWMRDVVFPRRPLGQLILVSGTGGGSTLPPSTSGNTATGRPGQSTNTGNNASNDGAPANNASNGNTTGGTSGGGTGTTTGGATATAGLMENPTVEGYPQGAAMAFLSRLVVASYSNTEKVFQRQMATTALNFQLSGGRVWDPDLYKKAGYGLFSDAVVRKILSTYPVGTSVAAALQARNRQLAGMAGTYRGTVAVGTLNSLAGGTIEITANSKGVVTGALTMNGRAYAFRGAIGRDGKVSAVAQGSPGERSYLLNLSFIAPGTTGARMTGTVTSGTEKVGLTAAVQDNQAVRNTRKIQTMAGRYEGVVHRAALNGQAGGTIRVNSDAKGVVTGQVRLNGQALPFRGKIDANGRIAARTDAAKGAPRYDLTLQMAQSGSASAANITGAISTGKLKATVRAHISPWSARKTAALYSGNFKVAMNPAPAGRKLASGVPKGARVADLTVKTDGTVVLKGQLGTKVPLTWTGRLTGDGRVLLQSPVNANGSVVGTVTVTNKGGRKSVSGALDWTKPPVGKDKGFKLNLAVAPR